MRETDAPDFFTAAPVGNAARPGDVLPVMGTERVWAERSSEASRRRSSAWVSTLGAALASVPVASLVIDGYHLARFREVWLAALWPMLTTAICMQLYLRWTRRSALVGVLLGPLLGVLNTGLMAGLFAFVERGELVAGLGTAVTALFFGFPVGLAVGLVFGVVLAALGAFEQSLRGREDGDAGLALEGFASAWGLVVAGLVVYLEAQRAPLSLAPGGPAVVGWLTLGGAIPWSAHTALRMGRMGRAMQRIARGQVSGLRLVAASEEERARVPGAEVTVVAEIETAEGPFREGVMHERLGAWPSLRTFAWRTTWLVVAACFLVGVIYATRSRQAAAVATTEAYAVTPGACESFRCDTNEPRAQRAESAW